MTGRVIDMMSLHAIANRIQAHSRAVDTHLDARDELQRVLSALAQIPEHAREVLLMATVEGLSHETIAALDLSVADRHPERVARRSPKNQARPR